MHPDIEKALLEEGFVLQGRALVESTRKFEFDLELEDFDKIRRMSSADFQRYEASLKEDSSRWLASYAWNTGKGGTFARRAYKKAKKLESLRENPPEVFQQVRELGVDPIKLVEQELLDVEEIEDYCNLYVEVAPFKPPYWLHPQLRALIRPPYNALPFETRVVLGIVEQDWVNARPGDVWRLVPVAKAWAWAPHLPKKVAFRVGQMPARQRAFAAVAWEETVNQIGEEAPFDELVFWRNLRRLSDSPLSALRMLGKNEYCFPLWVQRRKAEVIAGVPCDYFEELPLKEGCNAELPPNAWCNYDWSDWARLSAPEVLRAQFGRINKPLIKACKKASENNLNWVVSLGAGLRGNPDLITQFLEADLLPFEEEAVEFLKSIKPPKALRLLKTHTYKYQGEDYALPTWLVKDTGMLFSNILRLGETSKLPRRLRCWLSLHESFLKQYVNVLPDENLPLPERWRPIQGLSAVDKSWEIRIPVATSELKEWGNTLDNCVGVYGESIKRGISTVFAVLMYGKVSYCVEVDAENNLSQFLGEKNSPAPEELVNVICGQLSVNGLLEGWWVD